MKPIEGLDGLLERGVAKGMFGTKMRSVMKLADPQGIDAIVNQQFEVGLKILAAGLVPHPRARGRHQEPSEAFGRGAPQGGDPRPRR
jgi:hypothetical protein